jgi:hypothetical protein
MDDVERPVSERVIRAIAHNFPLSPALQSSLVDPVLINALNDFVDAFHHRTLESSPAADINRTTEICLRIGSAHRGGLWAVAKRFGDREVYIILEGCHTLNEMQELLGRVDISKVCGLIS